MKGKTNFSKVDKCYAFYDQKVLILLLNSEYSLSWSNFIQRREKRKMNQPPAQHDEFL